jgi:hypothetical protein
LGTAASDPEDANHNWWSKTLLQKAIPAPQLRRRGTRKIHHLNCFVWQSPDEKSKHLNFVDLALQPVLKIPAPQLVRTALLPSGTPANPAGKQINTHCSFSLIT